MFMYAMNNASLLGSLDDSSPQATAFGLLEQVSLNQWRCLEDIGPSNFVNLTERHIMVFTNEYLSI
jgi:hypothetical protein